MRSAGAEARIEEFLGGTPTAAEAAKAIGCELGQIVKSLVFDCGDRRVLVMVPGDRRADPRKVAAAAGCAQARIAGSEEVLEATGYAPGAVAPFPLPRVDGVYLERMLLARAVVWVGAGSPQHMAMLTPAELARLARAQLVDAVEDGP